MIKKIVGLLLTFIFLTSMCMTAFADGKIDVIYNYPSRG